MKKFVRCWFGVGALMFGFGVAAGAFGAHALKNQVSEQLLLVFEKAVFYHFLHSIGILLVAIGIGASYVPVTLGRRVLVCLLVGTVLFSGSLYLYVLTTLKFFAMITPLGGLTLMLTWVVLGLTLFGGEEGKS